MGKRIMIGIAGAARSGKDTAAHYLAKELCKHGYVDIISIADTMKRMVDVFLDGLWLPVEDTVEAGKEDIIPQLGVSKRRLYQTLGTDWGRNLIGEDVWMDAVMRQTSVYADMVTGPIYFILPDIRFDNEAKRMDRVLHVSRKERPDVEHHVSEDGTSIEHIDVFIKNDGTLKELRSVCTSEARSIVDDYAD